MAEQKQCDSCSVTTDHWHKRNMPINNEGERETFYLCLACDGEDVTGDCDICNSSD